MATNPQISVAARDAALAAIAALIDAGGAGTLRIYSGAQPADPGVAVSGQVLLASCTLSATSFAAPANGVAAANAIAPANPVASGTAGWFRIVSGGGVAVIDGTVGTSGADLNLGSTAIATGVPVSITGLTLSHP